LGGFFGVLGRVSRFWVGLDELVGSDQVGSVLEWGGLTSGFLKNFDRNPLLDHELAGPRIIRILTSCQSRSGHGLGFGGSDFTRPVFFLNTNAKTKRFMPIVLRLFLALPQKASVIGSDFWDRVSSKLDPTVLAWFSYATSNKLKTNLGRKLKIFNKLVSPTVPILILPSDWRWNRVLCANSKSEFFFFDKKDGDLSLQISINLDHKCVILWVQHVTTYNWYTIKQLCKVKQ
jgi:hypothetical protein